MSEQPKDNNVEPVKDPLLGYNIIRTAMVGAMSLAGAFGVAILIFSPENIAIAATLIGSAVTGPLTFIAGRKSQ